MLLDNELFIPKAWLRFIPNPDMLRKQKRTKKEHLTTVSFKWKRGFISILRAEEDTTDLRRGRITGLNACCYINCIYLFMVNGWRAGCCLGIQMILGELRLGLPSPELPILLVLPLIPMPWPTWEWFSMFLVFIGNVPLWKHHPILIKSCIPLLS